METTIFKPLFSQYKNVVLFKLEFNNTNNNGYKVANIDTQLNSASSLKYTIAQWSNLQMAIASFGHCIIKCSTILGLWHFKNDNLRVFCVAVLN